MHCSDLGPPATKTQESPGLLQSQQHLSWSCPRRQVLHLLPPRPLSIVTRWRAVEIMHWQGISWPSAKGAHPPASPSPCPKAAGSLPVTSALAQSPRSLSCLAAPLHSFQRSASPGRGPALSPSQPPSIPSHLLSHLLLPYLQEAICVDVQALRGFSPPHLCYFFTAHGAAHLDKQQKHTEGHRS